MFHYLFYFGIRNWSQTSTGPSGTQNRKPSAMVGPYLNLELIHVQCKVGLKLIFSFALKFPTSNVFHLQRFKDNQIRSFGSIGDFIHKGLIVEIPIHMLMT
jgi:hypothetical protein